MRTLVVLCAGGRKISNRPVYLNRHPDGKLLAEKAIEGIFSKSFDQIVFTILKEDNEQYNAKKIITEELGERYNVKFAVLAEPTSGPCESVYLTIKMLGITGGFAVRDSLNGIEVEKEITGNFVAGLDLSKYEGEVYKVRSKSFIVTNEQGQILDVIEKRFRSDIISVGLYGFKKTEDFLMAYEKLNDKNYPIKKMYLSNIISYLIGYKQCVFHCAKVLSHEDWGSLETWNRLQKKYATIFVDVDKLLQQYYSSELIDKLIVKLEKMSKKDFSIILFTRSTQIDKKIVYDKLEEHEINCIDFICGVSFSTEQIMISSDEGLEGILIGG